jgi:hypothetical protein
VADLYVSPVHYGIEDVGVAIGGASFPARIYYPSTEEGVFGVPILAGRFALVAFAPGERESDLDLCPQDATNDFRRWDAVLTLLARCGFVVVVADIHDVIERTEATAARLEQAIVWMRTGWQKRSSLLIPGVFVEEAARARRFEAELSGLPTEKSHEEQATESSEHRGSYGNDTESADEWAYDYAPYAMTAAARRLIDIPRPGLDAFSLPTATGLVGHSWGAKACALVAANRVVSIRGLASLAGTWDENDPVEALADGTYPTLMLAGTADDTSYSFLAGLWPRVAPGHRPAHQAALQGLGHWDWFSPDGGIQPCNRSGDGPVPKCPIGWQTASELILGFMTKHITGRWYTPSSLIDLGNRPPIYPWYENASTGCALQVRWAYPEDPPRFGVWTFGPWSEPPPWT